MIPDATVAWDDLAFGLSRLARCILCGSPVPVELGEAARCRRCGDDTTPWGTIWRCVDESTQRAQSIAFLVCHAHACRQSDHATMEAAVDQWLRARYGFVERSDSR